MLEVGPFDIVTFGPWPLARLTKDLISPYGSVLSPPDVSFGISTVTVKLKTSAGGLTCPPLFGKYSTASTPLAFAGIWETFPMEILMLLNVLVSFVQRHRQHC